MPSNEPARSGSVLDLVSSSAADRHRRAASTYERVAEHHDEAARFWLARDDPELAHLEQRSATLARQMAKLERDCAAVAGRRADASRALHSFVKGVCVGDEGRPRRRSAQLARGIGLDYRAEWVL